MSDARPPTSLVLLLAAGAGMSAASLYYNQPILGAIARDLRATSTEVGVLPTMTQAGYAMGILALAPLGDALDLRRVILLKGSLLVVALLLTGLAPSIGVLAGASLVIGLVATTAQDFVPAAAALAPPSSRGKIVGTAMTGLLLGILLSRVFSGVVADRAGWRAVYFGAAAVMAALLAVAHVLLPPMPAKTHAPYRTLLRSTVALLRLPPLRTAAIAQGLLSVAFSGFWSTLALVLERPPFGLGSAVAGSFGLAGAAGALVAPIAGALADKRGPPAVIRVGSSLVLASFVAMALAPRSLVVLVGATIVFDLGIQASLIAHQTVVYGLDPAARSRLNAVLVSSMFVGMAIGSAVASRVLATWGFVGVSVLGASSAAASLVVRAVSR